MPVHRIVCWVQCSLPCVSIPGLGSHAPDPMAIGGGRYSHERLLAKEDKNRWKPSWKSPRLSLRGEWGIAVRTQWQSGLNSGNGLAEK